MGKVQVTFRVMPAGVEVDAAALEKSVQGVLQGVLRGSQVKPVAFGLKAILATILIDDTAGGAEAYEAKLSGLEGVESVETVDVTLI